jgi:hypothetical protein
MAAPPLDQRTGHFLAGWRFRFQVAASLRPPPAMIFKVAVDVCGLVKNTATKAVVRKPPFTQIYSRAEAHAEVFSKGLIAPQIATRAYF